ncbi:MAG TPA: DUF3892 domain-containing protein [Solirubrobacteraceae bacterium]
MIEITAIRLEGGSGHQHITATLWRCATTSSGVATRQAIVDWLEQSNANRAVVVDGSAVIEVAIQRHPHLPPCPRTRVDRRWTDHLLSLPRC